MLIDKRTDISVMIFLSICGTGFCDIYCVARALLSLRLCGLSCLPHFYIAKRACVCVGNNIKND